MPWWLHSSAGFMLIRFGFGRSNRVKTPIHPEGGRVRRMTSTVFPCECADAAGPEPPAFLARFAARTFEPSRDINKSIR